MARFHNKELAKEVAKLHAQGFNNVEIAKKLEEETGVKFYKKKVQRYRKHALEAVEK